MGTRWWQVATRTSPPVWSGNYRKQQNISANVCKREGESMRCVFVYEGRPVTSHPGLILILVFICVQCQPLCWKSFLGLGLAWKKKVKGLSASVLLMLLLVSQTCWSWRGGWRPLENSPPPSSQSRGSDWHCVCAICPSTRLHSTLGQEILQHSRLNMKYRAGIVVPLHV